MCSPSLRRGALVLLLLSIPSLSQAGLTPRLVRDIDETSYAGSSSPRQFGPIEFGFAFTAFGGHELWIHSERNIDFKRVLRSAEIRQLGGPFYASREGGGWRFWLAVGNPYDAPYPCGGKPVSWLGAVYGDPSLLDVPVLFEAGRGKGHGLWTVNFGGPVELARPLPLEDGRLLRDYVPGRPASYFIARHPTLGTALWKTDGTRAGTQVVTAPSPGHTIPLRLAGFLKHRLLLAISGGEPELWWSDGSPRGLRPFLEIVPGRGKAAIISAARVVNGRAFLLVDDGRHGRQLWTSDGTAAGTVPLTRFASDPLRQIDLPVLRQNGLWYFAADDGVHGRELWRTDGTAQGTRLVTDLCPGPCSSDPRDLSFLSFGDAPGVYFTASEAEGPRALWRTDGTPQGVTRLTAPDVEATTGLQYDSFFAARTAGLGEEMWVTEGTPESTKLRVDLGLEEDSGSHPTLLGAARNRILFQTHAPSVGYGLWSSDGTAAGTYPVQAPPSLLLTKSAFLSGTSLGELVLVKGSTRASESLGALWSANGAAAGIVRLTPPGVDVQTEPVAVGSRAIFFAQDAEHGSELWVSQGTPESTHLLVDFVPGPDSDGANWYQFSRLHGQIVFQRFLSDGRLQLWLTDGTAEGTRPLVDADPLLSPLDNSGGLLFAEAGDKVFFFGASEPGGESVLWVSDGTAAGTAPLNYADSAGTFQGFFPAGDRMYFSVSVADPAGGLDIDHLWISDGTPAGTVQVPEARPVVSWEDGGIQPVALGDRLVFVNDDGNFWATDGTAAGTFPFRDPRGHEIYELGGQAIAFKDRLVFGTLFGDGTPGGGCYVWNGTGATVQQLEKPSTCGSFVPVGDRLYFNGFQPQTGSELWVMEDR